jgi:hypothetical protein
MEDSIPITLPAAGKRPKIISSKAAEIVAPPQKPRGRPKTVRTFTRTIYTNGDNLQLDKLDSDIPNDSVVFKLCTTKTKELCQLLAIANKGANCILYADKNELIFQITIANEHGIILLTIPSSLCDTYVYNLDEPMTRGFEVAKLRDCISKLDQGSSTCIYVSKKAMEHLVVISDDRMNSISTTKINFQDEDTRLISDDIAYDFKLEFDTPYFAREFGTQRRNGHCIVSVAVAETGITYICGDTTKKFKKCDSINIDKIGNKETALCKFHIDDLAKFNRHNKNEKRNYFEISDSNAIKVTYNFSNIGMTTLILHHNEN